MSLRDALHHQADVTEQLGSPFTAQLLRVVADRMQPGSPLTDRLFAWNGDLSARSQSVPLRLAGAFHGMVLDGTSPDLSAVYPPNTVDDDTLWTALDQAMTRHAGRIDAWLNNAPQTNETARSATLIAVGHWLTDRFSRPLRLSELGASAGLNLMWDHFALQTPNALLGSPESTVALTPDWRGQPATKAAPKVIERRGVDLNPLDPKTDELRMLAYIWPDQDDRLSRTRAAIKLAKAKVDKGDAADWLETRLKDTRPGTCHMLYHTIAWQYFPDAVQQRCTHLIEQAGARATMDTPLAWFGMEADGTTPGAAMTLRLWPGDLRFDMGRVDFHGRWIDWAPKQDKQDG